MRDELRRVIATDRAQARAIRRLVLRTIALKQARDLVFHDVPGFDSPVRIHQERALRKLAESDVILYAKLIANPDTTGPEESMLAVADAEDPHIPVAQKVFIALTKVDVLKAPQEVTKRIKEATQVWKGIPEGRMFPVSPLGALYRLGTGGPDVQEAGPKTDQDLKALGITDGVAELKRAVDQFIDTGKLGLLARRCDGLLAYLTAAAGDLAARLEGHYPDSPGDLVHAHEDRSEARFNQWWLREWGRIKQEFETYWAADVNPLQIRDRPAPIPRLAEFRARYGALVDQFTAGLPTADRDHLRRLCEQVGRVDGGVFVPEKAHALIRDMLVAEAMAAAERLAGQLVLSLQAVVDEVIGAISRLLWDDPRVAEQLRANRAR